MAIDLAELVERAKAAVNVPGADLFAAGDDADWILRLGNGFWLAYLVGYFRGYHLDIDTYEIVPDDDTADDLPQPDQHLIVLYTAYDAVRARMLSLPTGTRYKAGPVEAETTFSAQLLQALLKDLKSQLDQILLAVIQPYGSGVFFFDNLVRRDQQLLYGDLYDAGWAYDGVG